MARILMASGSLSAGSPGSFPVGKPYFVYLLTNAEASLIYTGITSDLERRVLQGHSGHGGRLRRAFRVNRLVHYETCFNSDTINLVEYPEW